jgi:hypothetical protein
MNARDVSHLNSIFSLAQTGTLKPEPTPRERTQADIARLIAERDRIDRAIAEHPDNVSAPAASVSKPVAAHKTYTVRKHRAEEPADEPPETGGKPQGSAFRPSSRAVRLSDAFAEYLHGEVERTGYGLKHIYPALPRAIQNGYTYDDFSCLVIQRARGQLPPAEIVEAIRGVYDTLPDKLERDDGPAAGPGRHIPGSSYGFSR